MVYVRFCPRGSIAATASLPMTHDAPTTTPDRTVHGRALAHERVRVAASAGPERFALRSGARVITFAELQRDAERLTVGLRSCGVRPGDRVGLLLRRGPPLVAALLAVLRTGAAYVPLDPKLPASRLSGMVEDAGVSLIVTDLDNAPEWMPDGPNRPRLTSIVDLTALAAPAESTEVPAVAQSVDASTLAYILFTSGSTGRPKGVEITHANLCCILDAWDGVAGPADDRPAVHLFHSTIAFDASLTEFLWPLTVGRTVAIAPEREGTPGAPGLHDGLGAIIESAGVTHLQCTPTRAVLMVADPDERRALRNIDHVLIGGEVLSTSLAHELLAAGVGRLTNIYGPTECSIWSLSHPVQELLGTTIPIGRPVAGARAAVVDESLVLVPDGTLGELLICGAFVGRGYAGRADLTAERFVELDIDGEPTRCYRTGDLAVRHPDGTYTYHGRIDTQVKLRGHRIELGEIEAALAGHPTVQQAVVVLQRGEEGAPDRLVALVVPRPDGSETPAETPAETPVWEEALRTWLRGSLPALMVPSRFLRVEGFAETPSGKVDRTGLADVVRSCLQLAPTQRQAQHNDDTDALAAMVDDLTIVLERADVGPDDDFFARGGNSLQGVHLLARIRARTGVELPLRVLLDAPTARTLVNVVGHPDGSSAVTPLVRFGPAASDRQLYLVHGAGGNVLGFRGLAKSLRDVAEVVGIQAWGVEPGREADRTLEAMVARYAAAIVADDAAGPYDLGGYSDGGTIAIHLAHELLRRGAVIRSLVLLDAYRSQALPPGRLGRIANVLRNARDRGGRPMVDWLRTSAAAWRARAGDVDAVAGRAAALGFVGVDKVVESAVAAANPIEPLAVPALLVRSTFHNPVHLLDYRLAASASQHLTTEWVGAPHLQMFETASLAELSAVVRAFLRRT